ncbi:ftsX-like permease family protein [Blastomonas sp. RAC04]|jgi:cell division transport system permease protein|uniref:cell division protein FtsX n=1 Tax=Blastomonas TaxID=150203 RepID=UPI00083E0F50|nr:FtsX-like permease family protein [Blastomonas sp. RAC04]AOF99757.1 ftsX-like permease family protein [Blastomonas sp. RAC04]
MLGALFPTAHDRRLIPQARLTGPMPWVIAVMLFLTLLASAAALALGSAADQINADLAGRATVQIVNADADIRQRQADAAQAVLRSDRAVAAVTRVSDAEVRSLLSPWLGSGALSEDIPLPSLIDVNFRAKADPATLGRLRDALGEAAPDARIDAHGQWLRPVFDLIGTLRWLAIALVALLALASIASVMLSARSSFAAHAETIDIMHLLGSTHAQIARLFQRRIALDAALGALIACLLAAPVLWLLGQAAARLDSGLVSAGSFGPLDWLLLATVPIAGIALAVLTARMTVLGALRKKL